MPRPLTALGTDGFGRSEGRAELRDFFEVDSRFIVLATLHELLRRARSSVPRSKKQSPTLESTRQNRTPSRRNRCKKLARKECRNRVD